MHYGYPKIGVFGDFRGENILFCHSNPQKALPCAETRLLTYSARKSVRRSGLYPCWRTQKKVRKNPGEGVHFTYMPGKTPLADFYQNWPFITSPRRNHPQQVSSKNLDWLLICGGPKFRSSHLPRTSILQTGSRYRGSQWLVKRVILITSNNNNTAST